MEDSNSDDWLPPGWTVHVRVRKNGKRDKYYFSPSYGQKFNSKVEVLRYLDNAQNKLSIQRIADNVFVEKGVAEGLPPGWMKKTRVTRKGNTIRKDSLYIDPVSGYAFRSLKDVDRYLESGDIGRKAFKPKDKGSAYVELQADKFSSVEKPTLSVGMGQSSDLDMISIDRHIQKIACSGEYMSLPISDHISTQCMVGTELTSSAPLLTECSHQKEGNIGLAESTSVPAGSKDEVSPQEKKLQENAQTKHESESALNRQRKRHKKEMNLPRRASKRLAGIEVDPVPELQTRNRARRVSAQQNNALEGDSATKSVESSNMLGESKPFNGKEVMKFLENGDKIDAKLDYSLACPLDELLTDPCIAFAVQTLTGVTFETSKPSQISSELKISGKPSEASAATAAEGYGKKIEGSNKGKEERNAIYSSPGKITSPKENAAYAEVNDKANEKLSRSCSEKKTLDISWMDPCIDFAIKTLTGTLPIDPDQNPKNCLQQQLGSSNTLYFGTQKPVFEHSFVEPSLHHTRNVGIGNSGGKDRKNVC